VCCVVLCRYRPREGPIPRLGSLPNALWVEFHNYILILTGQTAFASCNEIYKRTSNPLHKLCLWHILVITGFTKQSFFVTFGILLPQQFQTFSKLKLQILAGYIFNAAFIILYVEEFDTILFEHEACRGPCKRACFQYFYVCICIHPATGHIKVRIIIRTDSFF